MDKVRSPFFVAVLDTYSRQIAIHQQSGTRVAAESCQVSVQGLTTRVPYQALPHLVPCINS